MIVFTFIGYPIEEWKRAFLFSCSNPLHKISPGGFHGFLIQNLDAITPRRNGFMQQEEVCEMYFNASDVTLFMAQKEFIDTAIVPLVTVDLTPEK